MSEMTAEQVRRHDQQDPSSLLAAWRELAPDFEQGIAAFGMWPAFIDVWSHEHDLRGALDLPGSTDDEDTRDVLTLVTRAWRPRVHPQGPVQVVTDLGSVTLHAAEGPATVLRATAFEVDRLRLGRRSAAQVRAMDWSEPPGDWLDDLFVFGPRSEPLAY